MIYKRIGITGHSGILGKELIRCFKGKKIDRFFGNIKKRGDVEDWLKNKKFDAIFHLAALVPIKKVNKYYNEALKINYFGTKILIDQITKKNSTNWFFFSSTSHVYNYSNIKIKESARLKPISKYGLTKFKAEKYIYKKMNKTRFCIGRIFSFSHYNQNNLFFIPSIYNKFVNEKIVNVNNINHVRDYLSVKEISSAIKFLYNKRASGVFNIGSGNGVFLLTILNFFSKIFRKKFYVQKKNIVTKHVANIKKIIDLGWKPKKNINNILMDYHLNYQKFFKK